MAYVNSMIDELKNTNNNYTVVTGFPIPQRLSSVDEFEAVRCTRSAEFHFLFDKIKIGPLQCTDNTNMKVLMGSRASPDIPSGNYYMVTNEFFPLGATGIRTYLQGNALGEGFSYQ